MAIERGVTGVLSGLLGIDLKAQVALRDAARTAFAGYLIGSDLEHLGTTGHFDPFYFAKPIEAPLQQLIQRSASDIGQVFFRQLILDSMGLDVSVLERGAGDAFRTIERAIGFGIDVHLGTGIAQGGLKLLLGHAAPDGLFEALRILPESVGLNFFLGTVLASLFERATGTPMAEAINEKVRPARLEWPQIGRLLRQHDLTEPEAVTFLAKAGFPDNLIPLLQRLERSLLQVGDLQGLYEFGRYGDSQLLSGLQKLGFVGQDAEDIKWLYANKAQTEGGRAYAAVARAEFMQNHLTEPEYRSILETVNTPVMSIQWLIDSAILEKTHKQTVLTRGDIKSLRQQGIISNQEAVSRLVAAGMSESDATLILQEWDKEQKVAKTGLGTTRILAYLQSGIIDATRAMDLLTRNGMRSDDALFLIQHPETHPHQYRYEKTPDTIHGAYLDDIITYDEALQMLKDVGTDPDAASLQMQSLAVRKARGTKPKQIIKRLTEGQILEGIKFGLVSDQWAIRNLETEGYNDADAHYLVALEITKASGNLPDWWQTLA